MEEKNEICYEEPSPLNISIAIILIMGIIISYIPQYISIIRRKNSEGISYITLGIALLSGFLTAINSGILKWSNIICCLTKDLTIMNCLKNNLATGQILTGMFCIFVLLSAIAGILYYNFGIDSTTIYNYAKVLGVISAILMIFQWSPQIYITWKMKEAGSLSIGMLILQVPGSLLVIFFQGILNHSDFTTWGPYLFSCIQQLILIVLLIIFWNRNKKKKKLEHQLPNEESPLLNTKKEDLDN